MGGQSNITARMTDADGHEFVLRRPPLHGACSQPRTTWRANTASSTRADAGARSRRAARLLPRRRRDRCPVLRDVLRRGHRAQRQRHRRRRGLEVPARGHAGISPAGRRGRGTACGRRRCGRARRSRATRRARPPPAQAVAGAVRRVEHASAPGGRAGSTTCSRRASRASREHGRARRRLPPRGTASSTPAARSWPCSTGRSARSAIHVPTSATCWPPGPSPATREPPTTTTPPWPPASRIGMHSSSATPLDRDVTSPTSRTSSRSRSGDSPASSRACWHASSPAPEATPTPTSRTSGDGWRVARCSPRNTASGL